MSMKNYLKYTLSLLWVALLAGCVAEDDLGGKGTITTGKEARVKVTLQMPAASAPTTYAISETDENKVETIDVFAFKPDTDNPSGWAFAYAAEGTSIVDQPGDNTNKAKKQFNVTLIKDNEKEQTLVILANVRDQVEALGLIAEGADRDVLLARLVFENTGSWNANNEKDENAMDKKFTPFPMWGETKATINDAITEITGVKLLRGIARLDVLLDDAVTNFGLDEIYIYNSKKKGQIVPASANLDGIAKVKAATIPAGTINNGIPLKYEVPTGMERKFERTVYLFEAKAVAQDESSKATCIVVGGTFGADTKTTYYRLDFFEENGKTYKDVLRNHKYRSKITSVSGRGYPTPEDAFNSKPMNMTAEVVIWDDGDMGDVVFDGQYMLAVSQKIFEFPRDAKTGEVFIATDYDVAPNAGWKAVSSDDWLTLSSVEPASATSKVNGDGTASGEKDKKLKLVFAVTENAGEHRETTIKVTAGRLTQVITVKQSTTPEIGLQIIQGEEDNKKDISDSHLLFVSAVDVKPAGQVFKVNWAPIASPVNVSVTPLGGDEPFKFFTSGHDNITDGSLPGGTGEKTYNIRPAAIPEDDLIMNPFYERISKIDYTVSNGESYVSKYLILRQIVYNLVTIPENLPFYMMDGKTDNTFNIRVNFPWTAEVVAASNTKNGKNVIELITKSGSSNTTAAGSEIQFKIVDDRIAQEILSANPIVRFTHKDDPSVVFEVELSCGLCGMNGTAVKQKIGEKEYLTHFYGTGTNQRCWMVENLAEGTSSAQMYNGNTSRKNGYYYTHKQAASACPAGWHLPTSAEATTLRSEADTSDRNTNPVSKWWCGSQGGSNGAFAGYYYFHIVAWEYWGSYGYWWCGSGGQYFYGGSAGMLTDTNAGCWLGVRCVQDVK